MRLKVLALLALVLIPFPALAEIQEGTVTRIVDGDTLILTVPGKEQITVRLAEIDAPESRQPYGAKATQALTALALNQKVRAIIMDHDRWGRAIARLYVGLDNINYHLVNAGAAMVFRAYVSDYMLYALEEEAREAKRGLWALPEEQRIPPWKWRQQRP